MLVPSGAKIMRRPFVLNEPSLFLDLLQTNVPLGERVLAFAKKYGPLTRLGQPEALQGWRTLIRNLDYLLRVRSDVDQPIATLHLYLRRDRRGPTMVFAPLTMADALMVECAAISEPVKWCRECGIPFTGKKASAQFCSPTCKDNFHNRRKATQRT
jgi:hypothetical protein